MAYQNGPKQFQRYLAEQGRDIPARLSVIDMTGRIKREAKTQPPPAHESAAVVEIPVAEVRRMATRWREDGSRSLARAATLDSLADDAERRYEMLMSLTERE